MTTIAWDGETLAADQGMWAGGRMDRVVKAYRVQIEGATVLYGCLGVAAFALAMMRHLAQPEVVPLPRWQDWGVPDLNGGVAVGLAVFPLGVLYSYDAMGTRVRMLGHGPRGVVAEGAGAEFALGALLAGASAERAVEIAIEFSDFGGHGVTVLKHDQEVSNG